MGRRARRPGRKEEAAMRLIRVVLLLVGAALAFGPGPALAQGMKLTWWEHANPPP